MIGGVIYWSLNIVMDLISFWTIFFLLLLFLLIRWIINNFIMIGVFPITVIINLVLLPCISLVPYSREHNVYFGLQCSWEVLGFNGLPQKRSQLCLTSCLSRQHKKRGLKRWYLIQLPHLLFSLFLLQMYLILVTKPLEYPRFAWDLLLTLVNYIDV